MIIHNPIAALYNLLIAFYFASYYEVECSVTWIITAVVITVVLAISTPPIPGGGVIAYTLLFTQLGIPADGIAAVLAIDVIVDFILTASEMYCLLPALVNVASKVGMLNAEVLKAQK